MATTTGSMLSVAAGSPTAAALSPSPSSVLSVPSLSSFPSTMSPTTTRTTLSWYDQLIEFVRSRQGIFAILTVVFGLITLWSCCYRRRLAQRLAAAANENTQNNEQQGVETSNSSSRIQTPADEERHIRRLKILTSIVHKVCRYTLCSTALVNADKTCGENCVQQSFKKFVVKWRISLS